MTTQSKKFQKIYLNVDLRMVSQGAGGDWSHDSSLGCRNPPGSTKKFNFGRAKPKLM